MNLRLTWSIQCVPDQPRATTVRPCLRKNKNKQKESNQIKHQLLPGLQQLLVFPLPVSSWGINQVLPFLVASPAFKSVC